MDPSVPKYKVVILGEANSGKTSILLKYVTGQFSKVRKSSIQADFMEKRISVGNPPTPICMYIWDTAGGEQYHALGPIYYRDAHAAVIVYDITDGTSFEKVQRWVKELKKIVGEDIVIAVAGNKSDLHNARVVKKEDAIEFAKSREITHFDTSAASGLGIQEMFDYLANEVVKKSTGAKASKRKSITLVENQAPPKKSSCC